MNFKNYINILYAPLFNINIIATINSIIRRICFSKNKYERIKKGKKIAKSKKEKNE